MIYAAAAGHEPIDQGDLIDECPIVVLEGYDLDGASSPRAGFDSSRVLVLTQTCDLANRKSSRATVAVVHEARVLVESRTLKADEVRGPIRAARVWGWYFLPAKHPLGLVEMVVDLRNLHTVRLDLLADLCLRGRRPARLLSPYREHLAKHFADTFSRIGLPEPYETE